MEPTEHSFHLHNADTAPLTTESNSYSTGVTTGQLSPHVERCPLYTGQNPPPPAGHFFNLNRE